MITIISFIVLVVIGSIIWLSEREKPSTPVVPATASQAPTPSTNEPAPTAQLGPGELLDTYTDTLDTLVGTVQAAQAVSPEALVQQVEQHLLSTRVPAALRTKHLETWFEVQDISLGSSVDDVRAKILGAVETLAKEASTAPSEE